MFPFLNNLQMYAKCVDKLTNVSYITNVEFFYMFNFFFLSLIVTFKRGKFNTSIRNGFAAVDVGWSPMS